MPLAGESSRFCFSEKFGAVGTRTAISEIGKYSLEGRPPPREIRPGVLMYPAACLRMHGGRLLSLLKCA